MKNVFFLFIHCRVAQNNKMAFFTVLNFQGTQVINFCVFKLIVNDLGHDVCFNLTGPIQWQGSFTTYLNFLCR